MYTFITKHDSPNYTPGNEAVSVWGKPRTIEAIAIHHWGDPNTNPTFEGVVSWLCNPKSQSSAHFVATGTGRKVACLVNLPDASWATNSANPYTVSIECDPRCRDEDYDVVAELIAELRLEYGNLPLVPHKQFSKTACPGNYDLARLDRESRAKIAGKDFGTSKSPAVIPPTPAPAPVTPPAPLPTAPVPDKLDRIGAKVDENNALLKQILVLLTGLVNKITAIFK